jgi:hypothetical protein
MPSPRESFDYWRKRYKRERSNRTLRMYLTAKARLGRWDSRYLAYNGVASNVTAAVKAFITRGYAAGLVPTSTTGGSHAPNSLHYPRGGVGHAADLGLRSEEVGTAKGRRKMEKFQAAEFKRDQRGRVRLTELIGPSNRLVILRSKTSPLAEGAALEQAHDNHVHGAIA